jgi:hypothetical protein
VVRTDRFNFFDAAVGIGRQYGALPAPAASKQYTALPAR